MVWIHGGLFVMGSATTDLYGPEFLLTQDIVLVTVNYRLGALGRVNNNYKSKYFLPRIFQDSYA